jgi:hypothetical protein
MSGTVVLPVKLVGETRFFPTNGWDFTSELAVGETIASAAIAVTLFSGSDTNPAAMLSGPSTISGAYVKQLYTAGIAGNIYNLTCKATTSLGQVLELFGWLVVLPDNPSLAPGTNTAFTAGSDIGAGSSDTAGSS